MGGWVVWAPWAWAAPVTVEVAREVPAAIGVVRAVVADPDVVRASPYVRELAARPMAGGCTELAVWTRGLDDGLFYRALRCPTAEGYLERLVASEDFLANEAVWTLSPTARGTEVRLRVTTEPRVSAPAWLLRLALETSGDARLDAVEDAAVRP